MNGKGSRRLFPWSSTSKTIPNGSNTSRPSLAIQAHRKNHPHEGSKRLFLNISSISRTLSSVRKQKILPQIDQTYQTSLWRKQKILPQIDQTYQASLWRKQKTLPQYFKHLKNTILSKEAEDSSSNGSNLSTIIPIKEAEESFLNSSSISSIIPMKEVEDSSLMDLNMLRQSPIKM